MKLHTRKRPKLLTVYKLNRHLPADGVVVFFACGGCYNITVELGRGSHMKKGFDHQKYIEKQSRYILERVHKYDKLYLEFGGKLMADLHAKRVLPGFDPDK